MSENYRKVGMKVKIRVENVDFTYKNSKVLKGICTDIDKKEIVAIVGPNGAGKSTLIRCMDRILKPNCGCILLDEKDMSKMSLMEIAKKVGYIPQNNSQRFPATVFDTVLIGRRPHLGWRSSEDDIEKVLDVLELLNIEKFAMRDISQLSGGEYKRVIIARALVQEPDVLLLDEPTSDLDILHQLEVMDIVKSIVKKRNISAVFVIHDLNLCSRYADRVIMLKDGKIFSEGIPSLVMTSANIKKVYGVESKIYNGENGNEGPYVIPIRPA